jgi:hypothetical protein
MLFIRSPEPYCWVTKHTLLSFLYNTKASHNFGIANFAIKYYYVAWMWSMERAVQHSRFQISAYVVYNLDKEYLFIAY